MNTIQFLDEHLFPGQLGYFLTILSLVASLVATYSFARAFFSKEISLRAQWEKLAKIAFFIESVAVVSCFGV
jgi:cytochrome c-type biogenesis protein CcmF